ncbi:SHOCT domain-containing protein [Lachnospira hominis (ex Liu et al. 2021)]|uniref:EcsC family protein n=1 Tax=Lachnospira hominis (ex Liu et al. 2021) TaxID=2763051 RepID=A0ABR7G1H1_9FIRM|nr:EcsC family protein [Lachnospira hominis]
MVKVSRDKFLAETFATEDVIIQDVLDFGPVEAKVSKEKLAAISNKLILKRTSQSSVASFTAGFPGGLAMVATIPADVLQFFGMSLRLVQELSYLYGAQDLWRDCQVDDEKVKKQLLLYCGVMFGVSGAVSGVRVLSTQIAKTTLKKSPQKALTKTFWYPIVKQIGKAIGVKVTKTTVAQGFSKAIPVIGGVISGSINFASMMPMTNRLQKTLDSAAFGYTEEDLEKDIIEIENITADNPAEEKDIKSKFVDSGKKAISGISGLFTKKQPHETSRDNDVFETLKRISELKDNGIITEEEFSNKKAELLTKL